MYSQPVDLRNALAPGVWPAPDGQTAPKTNTAADLPDAQLVDAIAEADQLIDSYLGKRYATPVAGDPAPAPLRTWSRDIAAYLATLTFRRGKDLTDADPVVRRYSMTLTALTAVRDNKATLSLPTNAGPLASSGASAPVNPYSGHLIRAGDFDLTPGWTDSWGRAAYLPAVDGIGTPAGQLSAAQVAAILQGNSD